MRQHAWLLPPLQGYIHTTGPVLWTVEMEIQSLIDVPVINIQAFTIIGQVLTIVFK